ncbi:MAG: aminotransferase class IV, partial [Candidatus Jacksonbacteria bacterium]|nr:aminotransferase class IV [Candidatus Jacksonbacteria bacterium]
VSVSPPHYILEGTTFNFTLISDGILYTHPYDGAVLSGITLDIALKLAREKSILVKKERLPYETLRSADEAFITSVGRNVLPVIRVDDIVIGKGAPGSVTQLLMKAFEEYIERY